MPFSQDLSIWYDSNARQLPWRSFTTAYRVWVSEIMLQQTRVETVLPYFERFMARFPDLESLATSELEELLRLWEGLGYYSRACNLHMAARIVYTEYGGQLPSTAEGLERLPGIGGYTAAAIASIAFGEPVAAVDGNIKRIYSRILALREPYGSADFEKKIADYAQSILPQNRSGDFTQALMDLGSGICLPHQPLCEVCPVRNYCLAFQQGIQKDLPVRIRKVPVPHYDVCVAVIQLNGQVLLRQRGAKGVLAGLWEFPGGKLEDTDSSLVDCLKREVLEKTGLQIEVTEKLGVFKHAYTHFKISVHAWHAMPLATSAPLPADLQWVSITDLGDYPMGKVARVISNKVFAIT
ncbi:MAG: A/G-specific adenine glycosylase [Anaerolineaceae bacterium]|jgi:A/G-specific adenine glycosylase|nr:A/G-specific adenine glycosylase [Anaerolineaceae bacterium]MDD4042663.1 A/G-specific adenine glycosylase [Anaerolineaceae bacterium]